MTIRTTIKAAALAGLSALAIASGTANAGYMNMGGGCGFLGHNHDHDSDAFSSHAFGAESFTLLGTAWSPGENTARLYDGTPMPGGATWSVMGAGLKDDQGWDPHGGALTTELDALYGSGVSATDSFATAMDAWVAVSGFTNLGQAADGDVDFGSPDAEGGHLGDIRVGAIFIDGGVGPNVLAHAYTAGTEALCLAAPGCGEGGSILGDVHFDNDNIWSDGGGAGAIDFYTVALHELGHAIGLGHSSVVGSVMEAIYAGPRRTLHADDIAGAQALYGAADVVEPPVPGIPTPGTLLLLALGAVSLLSSRKRRA